MPADITIDDDGFLTVELKGASHTLDIYSVCNRIVELRESAAEDPNVYLPAVIEYLKTDLGYPEVSHRAAAKFMDAINDVVRTLRGKDGASTTRDSPGSTEPPPSPCPAG